MQKIKLSLMYAFIMGVLMRIKIHLGWDLGLTLQNE